MAKNTLEFPASTSEVARAAGISESTARSFAVDLEVPKVGPAYAWSEEDYDQVVEALDADDDDDDTDDDDTDDTDDDDTDEDADDEDADDEDADDE